MMEIMEQVPPPPMQVIPSRAPRKRRKSVLRDVIEMAIVVFIVYFGFRAIAVPYQVDGASMTPYLVEGERLFVSQLSYAHLETDDFWNVLPWEHRNSRDGFYLFDPPHRGDIIVLHPPYASDEPYIKRVVGLPGETITFANGSVSIDGIPLIEDYIDPEITWCSETPWCVVAVPDNSVFVLGDNRLDSTDSRRFGPIGYDQIIGKAVFASWPFGEFGPIQRPDYTP